MAAVGAAVAGALSAVDIVGVVSASLSFATTPLFVANTAISMAANMPKDPGAGVRIWVGMGAIGDPLDGRAPAVMFWNINGEFLGATGKSNDRIMMGNFHDTMVSFGNSNEPPEYMAIAANTKDAICISGITAIWPSGKGKSAILGNVGAACGLPWYPSRVKMSPDQIEEPICMWLDGSGKSKERITHPFSHGNVNDPPAGFSMHLPDFTGKHINNVTMAQRSAHPEFQCDHEARWKIWDDMRGKFAIPIFAEKPLKRGVNGTDTDDFMSKGVELSEPIPQYVAGKRDLTEDTTDDEQDTDEAAAKRKHFLLHQSLVKNSFSATTLCASGNSWGPDFYSYPEKKLCHMATKSIIPACSSDMKGECFDTESNEIRHASQSLFGRLLKRGQPKKQYAQIEDGFDPNLALLF